MGIELGSKRILNFFFKAWCHHHIRGRKEKMGNVSEDGNLQLHEKIIHTIIRETQSMQNSGQGIISKLAEDSKNNSFF